MTMAELLEEYRKPDHVLEPDDYNSALLTQSAVNSIALINSLARVAEKISKEASARGMGGVFRNSHPIIRLYLEQLVSLHGRDLDREGWDSYTTIESTAFTYSEVYDICMEKANASR